jgi:hypothetical protein
VGFTKSIPNNPLTQFNYSSLQMKEYTPVASSYGISGGNRLMWDQKEGLAFATASFNNDFSSKSNGSKSKCKW